MDITMLSNAFQQTPCALSDSVQSPPNFQPGGNLCFGGGKGHHFSGMRGATFLASCWEVSLDWSNVSTERWYVYLRE